MPACAACGHENREQARFCDECGVALTGTPSAAREERKVVTVLFADLVGFTGQAERLDPEDVRALLAPFHARLRAELERFGGTVEKFIGDAVMALFGAPVAHEDDPERAVRAALAIRDWVLDEGQLQVRIAVATGEALVTLDARPEAGEGMASGDIVNTTARLEAAAPPNGILVGDATYRATRHTIDYREREPVEAKGKAEPIRAWEAVHARSRLGIDLPHAVRAPLVGRRRETALLRETLVRVREERSPQLVTLVGVPGIGKSRLVHELFQAVEHGGVLTYWRQGRALPYGDGVTYWALGEMVKAQAGILETDPDEEVERKLQSAAHALLSDSSEARWVESQLRPLAGLAAADDRVADLHTEAFAAWRRFFEAMAEHRPLVLVFEDIHWADDGLLDFVDHLVEWATGVPILVVCTARPELLERRSGWGGGKLNATTLSLSPLSDDETSELFAALLDRQLLEAEFQQLLLAHAGGNPLYAEQFAQMHSERARAGDLHMPESVQGIIAARLDLLPAPEKGLLQDASVFGKVFWLGGLVDGRERSVADRQLHALERKGFVQRARRSSLADEVEFAFHHVLVRDVAYGQIPRAERAAKHRRVAEWMEELGRPEDHAEMLAHHYGSALELARAAGEPTAELEERARAALEAAGDRGLRLHAYPTAARFYAVAGALWPDGSLTHARLLLRAGRALYVAQQGGEDELSRAAAALVVLGDREGAAEAEVTLWELLLRRGQREAGDAHLEAAWELVSAEPTSRSKASVLMRVTLSHALAGRSEEAISTGRATLAMADELGLGDVRAAALNLIGIARVDLGERSGIADIERAVEVAREANAHYEVARAYNNLGSSHWILGEVAASRAALAACIDYAERFGQTVWLRWQAGGQAGDAYACGDWDRALELAEAFFADEGTSHYHAAGLLNIRALIRLGRGDVRGAARDAAQAAELVRSAMDPQVVYSNFAASAFVLLDAGDRTAAAALADEFVAALRDGVHIGGSASGLPCLAWTLALLGRADELPAALAHLPPSRWVDLATAFVEGRFGDAADVAAEMGFLPDEAYIRLCAAEKLAAERQDAQAAVEQEAALAFYRSVGATHYVRRGEALLAASA